MDDFVPEDNLEDIVTVANFEVIIPSITGQKNTVSFKMIPMMFLTSPVIFKVNLT